VTGALTFVRDPAAARRAADELVTGLDLDGRVEFLGPYTQAEAPAVMVLGDILLHTKVNDPCPGLVAEAMACGLPVVYSASGGVPELVGEDAGVGVETPLRWDAIVPPDPAALARAVLAVRERLDEHREAARRRAVEQLDIEPWLRRHAEVFAELLQ
jgi:glycosyltransferase involved in cell wall biosynthesis